MKNIISSNRTKGVLFIIISAFGFAMMSAFVKLSGDLPSFQKTFFRNITSCIIAFVLVVINKESFFGKLKKSEDFNFKVIIWNIGNSF